MVMRRGCSVAYLMEDHSQSDNNCVDRLALDRYSISALNTAQLIFPG